MGGGNAGLDPMGHGDDALYGKELRDALGSFPGGYVANGGDAGLAADHGKSNLANFQIRGVAQLDASADIYLDGNATDDAADSENDDNGPGVDAHMFDDLPVDTSQWSDVMRRRANGGPNGEFAFNPQPVNPNAAQHIFATRFSGGHGASTPSTEASVASFLQRLHETMVCPDWQKFFGNVGNYAQIEKSTQFIFCYMLFTFFLQFLTFLGVSPL